jgi:hypothetical protein
MITTITGFFFRMLQPHNYDAHVHTLPFCYAGKPDVLTSFLCQTMYLDNSAIQGT